MPDLGNILVGVRRWCSMMAPLGGCPMMAPRFDFRLARDGEPKFSEKALPPTGPIEATDSLTPTKILRLGLTYSLLYKSATRV